ncbi:unnamed protein product [Musa acuminata subsp. burmannicoides]
MDIKKPVMAIIQVWSKVFFYKYSQPSSQILKGSKRDLRAIDSPEKREVEDGGKWTLKLQELETREFVKLDKSMLIEVIMATNYLNARPLLDLTC